MMYSCDDVGDENYGRSTYHRPDTACPTLSAALSGSSCSQIRTTVHPACDNRKLIFSSRSLFASILARHHSAFFFGHVPWIGQPCQKQPSTNTTTRALGKTMSARLRMSGSGATCTRYRRPILCSAERSNFSGAVSRGLAASILLRAAMDDAVGTPLRRLFGLLLAHSFMPLVYRRTSNINARHGRSSAASPMIWAYTVRNYPVVKACHMGGEG